MYIESNTTTQLNLTAGDNCITCGAAWRNASGSSKMKYFIQNHPNTLDQNGEYYYDYNNQRIYIYYDGTLTDQDVWVINQDSVINVKNCSYVEIKNLEIWGGIKCGIQISGGDHVNIENNTVRYSGYIGINASVVSTITITSNNVYDGMSAGIVASACTSPSITNDTIKRMALDHSSLDRGSVVNGNGIEIYFRTTGVTITGNFIDSVAYCGIHVKEMEDRSGATSLIKNNVVSHWNQAMGDGAGVYIVGDDESMSKIIRKNICYLPVTKAAFLYGGVPFTMGIYLDNVTKYYLVDSNTVYKVPKSVFINYGGDYDTIRRNTFVAFGTDGETTTRVGSFYGERAGGSVNNLTFKHNKIVGTDDTGEMGFVWNNPDITFTQTGCLVDTNDYYNPIRILVDNDLFRMNSNWSVYQTYTLAEWRSLTTTWEAHSTYQKNSWDFGDVSGITEDQMVRVYMNGTPAAHTFELGTCAFKDLEGDDVSTSIEVQPYESRVLFYASGSLASADAEFWLGEQTPTPPEGSKAIWLNGKKAVLVGGRSQYIVK